MVKNRCLILADGFYEWHSPTGDFSGKTPKTPYYFRLPGHGPFAFAGLFDRWVHPGTGETLETVTLVNNAAPPWMQWCHHRVPVVLDAEKSERWLDVSKDIRPDLGGLIEPWPATGFEFYPVGNRVNAVKNDDAGCWEALKTPESPVQEDRGFRQGFLF